MSTNTSNAVLVSGQGSLPPWPPASDGRSGLHVLLRQVCARPLTFVSRRPGLANNRPINLLRRQSIACASHVPESCRLARPPPGPAGSPASPTARCARGTAGPRSPPWTCHPPQTARGDGSRGSPVRCSGRTCHRRYTGLRHASRRIDGRRPGWYATERATRLRTVGPAPGPATTGARAPRRTPVCRGTCLA